MAVELAKLALWLETVAVDKPLTFLDHHLRTGDSLVGATLDELSNLPDAPPLMRDFFQQLVGRSLPRLLDVVGQISNIPSDTVEHVRQKERIYRTFRLSRKPFKLIADVWCSTYFIPLERRMTPEEYQELLHILNRPGASDALSTNPHVYAGQTALLNASIIPFHWELEFPEIFFDQGGRKADTGFDAVIGNPPYDVLSDRELGRDLTALKAYLRHSAVYGPSFVGKNNLYKLFVCRALDLLKDGGRLGFITPMPILGDEQASGLRKEILRIGAFTKIEAFPQKDNPDKRVFRDAKLSTAIIGVLRSSSEAARSAQFHVRVHPENRIHPDSPDLLLSSSQIPLYDPGNMTIVSCSQHDWTLAVRLMASGRCARLGDYCTSHQGEVNEKTDEGLLEADPSVGPLVLRGANISLYALREASQGEALYIRESEFLEGRTETSRALQSRERRIGFQRSSPQNNFRRLIACLIPRSQYCFDTVSYIPESETRLPMPFVLALLNT